MTTNLSLRGFEIVHDRIVKFMRAKHQVQIGAGLLYRAMSEACDGTIEGASLMAYDKQTPTGHIQSQGNWRHMTDEEAGSLSQIAQTAIREL